MRAASANPRAFALFSSGRSSGWRREPSYVASAPGCASGGIMNSRNEAANGLELPSDLICEDFEAFKQWLLLALAREQPVTLCGRTVTRVGTSALQLMLALRRECDARAIPFELREPSRALLDTLACMGLTDALLRESAHPGCVAEMRNGSLSVSPRSPGVSGSQPTRA